MSQTPHQHIAFMRLALRLAKRAYGETSPNPLVGAVLVKRGKIIGRGWHHRAGQPHGEIEALHDAEKRGENPTGATLYVTLEPCCTHGRTPPCTGAVIAAKIKTVVVAATDPNPNHRGHGFSVLRKAGIKVIANVLAEEAERLNESFNHWIVHRTPYVTVKAAMTLDGKIATASGESKWITSEKSRSRAMQIRQGADAILVGVNTVLFDDPALTVRKGERLAKTQKRRIILDPSGRTPLTARLLNDEFASNTTIVVTSKASKKAIDALMKKVSVVTAPLRRDKIDLRWLMKKLGKENVTSLLVEGGGETNALFFEQGLTHRVAFFYAAKILGGRDSRKGVAGSGITKASEKILLKNVEWAQCGEDLLLSANVSKSS